MSNLIKFPFLISSLLLIAANQYNSNTTHVVSEVLNYYADRTILFRSQNMPNIPNCSGQYFVIPAEGDDVARAQLYSRLLTAYASKESVNIGYDGVNCGPSGYIMVYRIG